jgi:hypothetical protein
MTGEHSLGPEENRSGSQENSPRRLETLRRMSKILGRVAVLTSVVSSIVMAGVFYYYVSTHKEAIERINGTLTAHHSHLERLDTQTAVLEQSESMLQGQLQQLKGQLAPGRRPHLEELATVVLRSLPEITEAVNKMDPRGILIDGLSAFLKEAGPVIIALIRKEADRSPVCQSPNPSREPTTVSVVNVIAREEYTAHLGKDASTPVVCPTAPTCRTTRQGGGPSTPVKMASCPKKG